MKKNNKLNEWIVSFCIALQTLVILLKLIGAINLSWWIITVAIWFPIIMILLLLIGVFIAALIVTVVQILTGQ